MDIWAFKPKLYFISLLFCYFCVVLKNNFNVNKNISMMIMPWFSISETHSFYCLSSASTGFDEINESHRCIPKTIVYKFNALTHYNRTILQSCKPVFVCVCQLPAQSYCPSGSLSTVPVLLPTSPARCHQDPTNVQWQTQSHVAHPWI